MKSKDDASSHGKEVKDTDSKNKLRAWDAAKQCWHQRIWYSKSKKGHNVAPKWQFEQ